MFMPRAVRNGRAGRVYRIRIVNMFGTTERRSFWIWIIWDHLGLLCNWIIGDLFTAPCCTHVALPYFPHIDYRLFRYLLLTLEFWVKLQGRNLKLYSAWACDPSSDLQLLLPRIWSDSCQIFMDSLEVQWRGQNWMPREDCLALRILLCCSLI